MGQLHSHVSEPRPSVVIATLVKWYAKTASETAKMTIVLALTKMAWHVTSVDQIEPLSVRCATHSVALRQVLLRSCVCSCCCVIIQWSSNDIQIVCLHLYICALLGNFHPAPAGIGKNRIQSQGRSYVYSN